MSYAAATNRTKAEDDVATTAVQIDGLVALKIVQHCKDNMPALVTGQLLGLDVGSTLEVTHCFPFPVRAQGRARGTFGQGRGTGITPKGARRSNSRGGGRGASARKRCSARPCRPNAALIRMGPANPPTQAPDALFSLSARHFYPYLSPARAALPLPGAATTLLPARCDGHIRRRPSGCPSYRTCDFRTARTTKRTTRTAPTTSWR